MSRKYTEDDMAEARWARQAARQSDYGQDPVAAELAAADRIAEGDDSGPEERHERPDYDPEIAPW